MAASVGRNAGAVTLWKAVVVASAVLGVPFSVFAQTADDGALPADIWRELFRRPPPVSRTAIQTARTDLGVKLFADARLSKDGMWSCRTCHSGSTLTDGRARARGRNGPLKRNTPTLLGIGHAPLFNWDGSAGSLSAQFERPVTSTDEMAGQWDRIVRTLAGDADYARRFRSAFPTAPAIERGTIKQALAAAVESFVPPVTRFDRWIEGEATALSSLEREGFRIFTGKGNCATCHSGWRFTDDKFYDIGLRAPDQRDGADVDLGRGGVPGGVPGLRAFKTPTLRQVSRTAPFMHDGGKATLAAVVAHYAGGFEDRRGVATNIRRDLKLTQDERRALIAFLKVL